MRLRNIYILCKDNLEAVTPKIEQYTVNGKSGYKVNGWLLCRQSLEELRKIEYFVEKVDDILNKVPAFFFSKDAFELSSTEGQRLSNALASLRNVMRNVTELCESMGLNNEEDVLGLDIKMPICSDFSEYVKSLSEIEFILYKCPLFRGEEQLKFHNVDVGSNWLCFIVSAATQLSSKILNNVAAFIDKCYIIKSHKNTVDAQKVVVETMEMEKEAKAKLLEGITEIYNAQVKTVVAELEQTTGIELKNGEERDVVIMSMEKANNLFDRGMEIYAAIDTPHEIKVLFEPLEMKYIGEKKKVELIETESKE